MLELRRGLEPMLKREFNLPREFWYGLRCMGVCDGDKWWRRYEVEMFLGE